VESSAWILVRVAVAVPFTLLGIVWLAGGLIMLFKLVQSRQWATTSELMARVGEMLAIFALSAGALAVAIAAIVLPSSRRRIRGGVG